MPNKSPQKKSVKKKRAEKDITDLYITKESPSEELKIKEFRWTSNQQKVVDLLLDKKLRCLFLAGPAGSAKSLVSVFGALKLLQEKRINEINYLRAAVESASNKIGFLPGAVEDKLGPYFAPLEEKLMELLPQGQITSLLAEQVIKAGPINYLRGRTLTGYNIIDEAQCLDFKELTTVITRMKEGSRMIFAGDLAQQKDIKNSGFATFYNLFDTEEARSKGIFCMSFGPEDIRRSQILRFICETIEEYQK